MKLNKNGYPVANYYIDFRGINFAQLIFINAFIEEYRRKWK